MRNTALSIVAAVIAIMVFAQHGVPAVSRAMSNYTRESALAEKAARDILDAKKAVKPKTITVNTENWSEDLLRELNDGETIEFTPVGSPGTHVLILINDDRAIEWYTSDPPVHVRGATMRIKVDPHHHPTGTRATVYYKVQS